ncbi:MAG: phosphoribosylformylglycinamidine synthase [Lachnospiraceae bacterium]|nr:phosphoribosylformylglycinamidine synthase [Lachnospiraceae bacterium]
MGVRRVYAEKKKEYAVAAKELLHECRHTLGIGSLKDLRILIRYDIENLSEETYAKALHTVFSEPPLDMVYEEKFEAEEAYVFSSEYLPGQYDQRADSAEQCLKLLDEKADCRVRSATTYVLYGVLSEDEIRAVKKQCINPVDSRVAAEEKPETLLAVYPEPEDIPVLTGFCTMDGDAFERLYSSLSLAMTLPDFYHIRSWFSEEEKRDPTLTEIRVLDTYWSDHCRHTTFLTELKEISVEGGAYSGPIEMALSEYRRTFAELYKGRSDKYVCLMDIALLAMKKLKAEGKLKDQEESDEINACSIVVPIEVSGNKEEWLLNFKNETHNHPTEIEPFGGAATCLGGAIRDPLSGRTYVYQAMRITGAADPTVPVSETMEGKLPQKLLVRQAAHGYSSYGNQVGLATGLVKEIYHPAYAAKRMEIGAVLGAAKRSAVRRLTSDPGNVILLLGGRTGRDGIGGATGSSKAHTTSSIEVCGAEVQKGNAPTERKIQRMFRRPEVSAMIRKCNDFGAGGVSVAIGELAEGLSIDLDKVPKKYEGLDGTEIAISESQERMAVVIDKANMKRFLAFAEEENLEATEVARVTDDGVLSMTWRGKEIVHLKRAFLDTNGAHQEAMAVLTSPKKEDNWFAEEKTGSFTELLRSALSDLNGCSQKGLVEMFDSSIGSGTVLMPYGGKYQRTESQVMAAKFPVLEGNTDAVSLMSYGFDPALSSWSPFHGAQFAVVTSVAKIVGAGGDYRKIRFTFQEYFRRMTASPSTWGEPAAALLGAFHAQLQLGLPSIGGKDSMSGSFNELNVPPTLVSFAVDVARENEIVSPELKAAGNVLVVIPAYRNAFDLPDYDKLKTAWEAVNINILSGNIISSYVAEGRGIAYALTQMCFGNELGAAVSPEVSLQELFSHKAGDLVLEVKKEAEEALLSLEGAYRLGEVLPDPVLTYGEERAELSEAVRIWEEPLSRIFHHYGEGSEEKMEAEAYTKGPVISRAGLKQKPKVFIPVFPGTNCEYDSARAFRRAGADTEIRVFKNRSESDIREAVAEFAETMSRCQIIMFPGGFSAGDEPEGSAKFIASVFRNDRLRRELEKLLKERDGLALGICNGFQALIKLGLLPYGEIREQTEDSPTLTYNTVGRHISHMVHTKVVSNLSPWLSGAEVGKVYTNPASHGEGRFVANDEWIRKLFENGQVATQYSDPEGKVSMDSRWNVNGSFHAIEGITSPDGRILGKMAHVERRGDGVAINIYGEQDMKIFEAGVKYYK